MWFLNATYINWTLLVCCQSPERQFLSFWKNFNIWKHQRFFLCCFLVSKHVFSIVIWQFNFKMHQPQPSCCCLNSKYTNHTLFPSLSRLKMQDLAFVLCFGVQNFNHTHFDADSTLNTPNTCCFFVYNHWKCNIYLSCCALAFKTTVVRLFLLRNL